MEQVDTGASEVTTEQAAPDAPLLIDWIWRPWYAKVWWIGIAAFWAGALIYPLLGIHRFPLNDNALMHLAVILHPQAALLVLGCGYLRALIAFHRGHGDDAGCIIESQQHFDEMRKRMYDMSNPANPLSPLNPANPAHPNFIRD